MVLLSAAHTVSAHAAALVCPSSLAPRVTDPFTLVGKPPASAAPLDAFSVIEGEPGDEAKDAPATLVPDLTRRDKQRVNVWDLMPRDVPLLMVCSYRGTSAYLRAVVPQDLKVCEFTLDRHPPVGQCR